MPTIWLFGFSTQFRTRASRLPVGMALADAIVLVPMPDIPNGIKPPMPGPLALIGSGEYLPAMAEIEASLILGRGPRYVQIPTAAASEGRTRLDYWVDLGIQQARRLGVEAVPMVLETREDANDLENAKLLDGAGLIYLSGGRPDFLVSTLEETVVFEKMLASWRSGAALAGCSAGAMALCEWVPGIGLARANARHGFGVVRTLAVLPHFDRMAARIPDMLRDMAINPPAGVSLIGIDEQTALIWENGIWRVEGEGCVWDLGQHRRERYKVGMDLRGAPLPEL